MSEHSSKPHEFVSSNREDGGCGYWNGRAFCNNYPSHPIHVQAEPKSVERSSDETFALLKDSHAVHVNILRGQIALTKEQAIHIAGLPADIEQQLSQAQQRITSLEAELEAINGDISCPDCDRGDY